MCGNGISDRFTKGRDYPGISLMYFKVIFFAVTVRKENDFNNFTLAESLFFLLPGF